MRGLRGRDTGCRRGFRLRSRRGFRFRGRWWLCRGCTCRRRTRGRFRGRRCPCWRCTRGRRTRGRCAGGQLGHRWRFVGRDARRSVGLRGCGRRGLGRRRRVRGWLRRRRERRARAFTRRERQDQRESGAVTHLAHHAPRSISLYDLTSSIAVGLTRRHARSYRGLTKARRDLCRATREPRSRSVACSRRRPRYRRRRRGSRRRSLRSAPSRRRRDRHTRWGARSTRSLPRR
jgi:hypothetical protein